MFQNELDEIKKIDKDTRSVVLVNIILLDNPVKYDLPNNEAALKNKRFEGYQYENGKSRFGETSDQFNIQKQCYTDENGFRRVSLCGIEKDAYTIAVGEYYCYNPIIDTKPKCGGIFKVTWENGTHDYLVIGDQKVYGDTNETYQYTINKKYGVNETNTDMIEFIVDEYSSEFIQTGAKTDGVYGAPHSQSGLFENKVTGLELIGGLK